MKLNFATFFDKNYLSKGIILIKSLEKYLEDFTIYLVCIDDYTKEYFTEHKNEFKNVIAITLNDVENGDSKLLEAKENRSTIEYYFTLSPCIPLYLLKKYNLTHICTLDADIKFYASPTRIFKYLEDYSIIITPHKFSKEIKHLESFGKYNVSFQIFKNNTVGLRCLTEWKNQCIEWCGDYLDKENNRYADQKYLDNWCNLYNTDIKVLDDCVSGIAPWNLNNYKIVKNKIGDYLSNDKRIIFYHFHHFKFLRKRWASNGFFIYSADYQKGIKHIYADYWAENQKILKNLGFELNNNLRENISSSIKSLIKNQKTLFFKFNNTKIIYIDVTKLNPTLKKVLSFLYAKIN